MLTTIETHLKSGHTTPCRYEVTAEDDWENLHMGRLGEAVKRLLESEVLIFKYRGSDYQYDSSQSKFISKTIAPAQ